MAFTERELEISNKSYTNKDFAAIYEELLTIAEKISDRFSPTTSVETDPFIVLLKLAAFVADKVNYNIDKNLLETFISSCTQEESMRELTEMLGYNMHYYKAAETEIFLNYKYPEKLIENIKIPKYSVIESASKIPFVTLNDEVIHKDKNTSGEIRVIQGKLQTLTILGNSAIQLENLTENNRLYFPELMVAENGVIITNNLNSSWKKVENLNTQIFGLPCYKFGFDSKRNLPYVEFPDWISDIIGDGLYVDYIVTQGEIGNIAAKELTTVKKRTVVENGQVINDNIDNADIRVVQLSAAVSGSNPETIDQSYKGFKKVIGTFDTLITCRDYANAIYNMLNNVGAPIVSNVQVADRRTDINYACDVITYNGGLGVVSEPIPIKIENGSNRQDAMTPFDLTIYPFNPINNTTYSAISSGVDGFDSSFKLLTDDKKNSIISRLDLDDNYKSICHTYKELAADDIVSVQNYYSLNAVVNTTAKVNVLEQADIIANIYNAIAREFNARKLNFGYEIPFDELIMVMENADKRIKSISLQEPIQTPKIITKNGKVHDVFDTNQDSEVFKFIVAKNVLAGRASLFEYDLDFKYDYSYSTVIKVEDVEKITTKCNIDSINPGVEYPLKDNEVIQFLAPNLITENIYTAGVYYYLFLNSGATSIPANTDYQLQTGDKLFFYYFSNNKWEKDDILEGRIINSKKMLATTATHGGDPDSTYDTSYNLYALLSDQQVEIKKINQEELTSQKRCYWITNEPENLINWDDNTYILKENEYFFYSDINLSSLHAFGSGTKLICSGSMAGWNWKSEKDINIDDITTDGIYALRDAFKIITFTTSNKLTLVENEIIILTEGDSVKVKADSPVSLNISNNIFETIGTAKIQYKFANQTDFEDLQDRSYIDNANWSCRSLLDINCGPDLEQILVGNQVITYTTNTNDIGQIEAQEALKFNTLVQKGGGINLHMGYITLNNLDKEIYPTLLVITKADDCALDQLANGMYSPRFGTGVNTAKFYASPLTINETVSDTDRYTMIYIDGTVDSNNLPYLQAFENGEPGEPAAAVGTSKGLTKGVNIVNLNIDEEYDYWTINRSDTTQSFTISPIKYVKGINPLLGLQSTDLQQFTEYLEETFPEQYEKFYSIADLDPSKEIELSETYPLSSAQAFYDSNNIANKWVLPKIDFSAKKINITIARNSMK